MSARYLQLTRKDQTVRRKRWIRAFVLAAAAATPVVQMFAFPLTSMGADESDSLSDLVNTIISPATPVAKRNEAAVRLVQIDSTQARADVKSCLADAGKPLAQAAIADAVAQSSNPDKELIPTLGQLLGSSHLLTPAAAAALVNYGANPDAFHRLTDFIDIQKNPNNVRTDAIKAMGSYTDRAAAEYLIRLLSLPNQNTAIQNAAMSALGEMTGITSFRTTDILQWQHWWSSVKGKQQDQFAAMLLETRVRQFEREKQRDLQLANSASGLLAKHQIDVPDVRPKPGDKQKSDWLLIYLDDPAPDIRKVGIRLATDSFFQNKPPNEEVRTKLFELISDVDDDVRLKDITFLLILKDHQALKPLMDQLKVERDLRIKVEIAKVLGELADASAVPALLNLLHDPEPEARAAAAKEFSGSLGTRLRQADPSKADEASQQIRDLLAANDGVPGTEELRAACLSALSALRDKNSFDTFNKYLQPGQPSEVRCAALLGLGNLGSTNADQMVATQLRDNDKTVRLAAATALQTVARPEQADQIFNLMNSDSDEDVRQALWIAFQNLYSQESPEDLEHWQAQFDSDPPKKLATLQKLNEALQKAGDKQAVALNQQNLAAAYMAVKPPHATEAIQNLQSALDYWRGTGGNDLHLESLVEQLMDAQLQDGRYEDAVAFAQKQIALTPEFALTLGLKISQKADELLRDNNLTGSQALVTEALKMAPPLDARYLNKIRATQADLKQRGAAPAGP